MNKAEFKQIIENIPEATGVYLFTDRKGVFLYIGKSISLQKRLKSYYDNFEKDSKTNNLIRQSSNIKTMLAPTEKDALLLENNLIKAHKPKYNVLLKDDKQYPLLEVNTSIDFPIVSFKRRIENKNNIYFGPFISSRKLKENIRYLRRLFRIRSCNNAIIPDKNKTPCLYHQIGNCSSPCSDLISKEEYNENVSDLILFLKGKQNELLENLQEKMLYYSNRQMYEKASYIRDNLLYLKGILEKQRVVINSNKDIDIIGTYIEGEYIVISILYIRNCHIIDKKDSSFYIKDKIIDDEFLYNFIINQYTEKSYIPDLLVLKNKSIDKNLLKKVLMDYKKNIRIISHPRKQLNYMMQIAIKNAQSYFNTKLMYHQTYIENIKESIRETLGLDKTPEIFDCFDISNLFGKHSVGVCIRFFNSQPKKSFYRKFNIKTRIDDFEAIKESVHRRYKKMEKEDLPDLIIIDGGPSQLSKALLSIQSLSLKIPIISISKINKKDQKFEKIHLVDKTTIDITPHDSHLLFLSKIRDEAHRFAVTSHRSKRKKDITRSILDEIPGIGQKRKKALMDHFKTMENIKKASIKDLMDIKGISKDLAITIKTFLN